MHLELRNHGGGAAPPAPNGDADSGSTSSAASPGTSSQTTNSANTDSSRSASTGSKTNDSMSSNGSGSVSTSSSTGNGTTSPAGSVAFAADRVVVTGVRSTATPAAQSVITLHNAGASAVQVTALSLGGANAALFEVVTPVPATIVAGANLQVTVQMTTTGAGLPALPPGPAPYDAGSNLLTGTLTATWASGTAQANVYGLLLVQDNYEPTLGQILTTLGYPLDVGQAQNDWNPNTSMMAANLPGIETGTDEVAAPYFVKASPGNVTMTVAARFSPVGLLPYGFFPSGSSTARTTVGSMSMITDAQTSDKARMVYPPLATGSATTFDPGSGPFGIWVYSDQKRRKYNEGGNPANGDYDFTVDALNTPANVHRVKTYPLKDKTGAIVPQNYLLAVEEAANGDYQDYVFVLGNVNVSP